MNSLNAKDLISMLKPSAGLSMANFWPLLNAANRQHGWSISIEQTHADGSQLNPVQIAAGVETPPEEKGQWMVYANDRFPARHSRLEVALVISLISNLLGADMEQEILETMNQKKENLQ